MERQNHLIAQQIFDLSCSSETSARETQDRVSDLSKNALLRAIETVLDEVVPKDVILRIDRLDLPIGIIREDQLEEELLEKIPATLRRILELKIQDIENGKAAPNEQMISFPYRDLELLQLFLEKGYWPHHKIGINTDFSHWYDKVFASQSASMLSFLKKDSYKQSILQRLVAHLDDKRIEQLIRVTEPAESEFILQTVSNVKHTQRKKRIFAVPENELNKELWHVVLRYLFVDRGSQFNRKTFLESMLRNTAAAFNQEFSSLLELLYKAVLELRSTYLYFQGLPLLILTLFQEQESSQFSEVEKKEEEEEGWVLPETEWDESFVLNINKYWAKFSKEEKEHLISWLVASDSFRRRWVLVQEEEFIKKIIVFILPQHSAFIFSFSQELDEIHEKEVFTGKSVDSFRKDKWDFIITTLLVDRGSHFNNTSFVKSVLWKMSQRYALKYTFLLKLIFTKIKELKRKTTASNKLFVILKDLQREEKIEEEPSMSELEKAFAIYRVGVRERKFWTLKKTSPKLAEQVLMAFLKIRSTQWEWAQDLLIESIEQKKWRINLIELMLETKDGMHVLLETAVPGNSENIRFYSEALQEIKGRTGQSFQSNEFEKIKWELLLMELLVNRGSQFNFYAYLSVTIRKFAAHFNLDHQEFGNLVIEVLSSLKSTIPESIKGSLKALRKEFLPKNQSDSLNQPSPVLKENFLKELKRGSDFYEFIQQHFPERITVVQLSTYSKELVVLMRRNTQEWLVFLQFLTTTFRVKELESIFKNWEITDLTHFGQVVLTKKENTSWWKDWVLIINQSDVNKNKSRAIEHFMTQAVFSLSWFNQQKNSTTIQAFLRHYLNNLFLISNNEEWASLLISLLKGGNTMKALFKSTVLLDLGKLIREEETNDRELVRLSEIKKATTEQEKPHQEPSSFSESTPEEGEKVWIKNAGIVLLWPYLQRLFRMLDYLGASTFKSEEEAYRAVHLLQYMCTGKEQFPEFELVLNKMLCGIEQAKPILADLQLTDAEKDLGDDLLRGVIQNWPALGSTSPEGLRETFLERDGFLEFQENVVELKVEQKSFDVLIDRIPWSIAGVRLPWMKNALRIVWR